MRRARRVVFFARFGRRTVNHVAIRRGRNENTFAVFVGKREKYGFDERDFGLVKHEVFAFSESGFVRFVGQKRVDIGRAAARAVDKIFRFVFAALGFYDKLSVKAYAFYFFFKADFRTVQNCPVAKRDRELIRRNDTRVLCVKRADDFGIYAVLNFVDFFAVDDSRVDAVRFRAFQKF